MIAASTQRVLRLLPKSLLLRQPFSISKGLRPMGLTRIQYSFSDLHKQNTQKMEFKTETKRLLDIVAKSLYTDQEVFIRELLSNSSDALEKQRLKDDTGDLTIKLTANETKKQLVLEDNGIGMTKDELMNNLGTIARSGSREFVEELSKKSDPNQNAENIIGQFGVGFYSSFIVADYVDVFSVGKDGKTHCWSSDGSGTYEISEVQDSDLKRGTRIVLHLKPSCNKFVDPKEIKAIVQRYSNFINYPISLNGEKIEMEKALWSRDKRELKDEDYSKLYSQMTGGNGKYFTKIHYTADVPLSIKSILYVPNDHMERYGIGQERNEISLYSKKVLIKKECKELLPNYLRFVKGVVDCEDIPLNISRETYQDSALINKIKVVLTNRILKHLREEADKNPIEYNVWYKQFQVFIKEGSLESSHNKDLIDLNRFKNNLNDKWISLKQYVEMAKENKTEVILYSVGGIKGTSPYLEPFNKAGVPVILSQIHLDEVIFKNIGTYENMKFVNIETSEEDVSKYLGEHAKRDESKDTIKDTTTFALWIKNELQPIVSKVEITKKNISGPGLVLSPVSASMRQLKMFQEMMQQRGEKGAASNDDLKNLTFEINPQHEIMVGISELRKSDNDTASILLKQIFDNCCVEANLETDKKDFIPRINKLMKKLLDYENQKKDGETKEPTRK